MLIIYRRHKKFCEHKSKGRKYRRCQCPIWVQGLLRGTKLRKSLDTGDWQRAHETVREWEANLGRTEAPNEPITILEAATRFLNDGKARQLNDSTLYKYRLMFKQTTDFASRHGLRYLKDLDLVTLDDFRAEWKDGARSSLKKVERLRAFLRFCERRKWDRL
jgi:hypothetical protein